MTDEHTLLQRFVELLEELRRPELARNPLRGIGISPPQFAPLDRIAREAGPTLGEIAAALIVTPPTISVALRRLEELELVRKSRDPRDRQNIRVYPTEKGKASTGRRRSSIASGPNGRFPHCRPRNGRSWSTCWRKP